MSKKGISIIGLGSMGQAITREYLKNGCEVTVWNRTVSKADDMVKIGAKKAASITDLLNANKWIILSLIDYDAMYKVFDEHAAFLQGKTMINLSSDTPENAREATRWAKDLGAKYLTGAIMVEPQTLGQPDALVFYSGDSSVFEACRSALDVLGITDYIGKDPGLAQLYSIALLNILFTNAVGVFQSIALLQSANIKPTAFEPYLNDFLIVVPQMLEGISEEAEKKEYSGEMNNMDMMSAAMTHVAPLPGMQASIHLYPILLQISLPKPLKEATAKRDLQALLKYSKKETESNRHRV